MIEVIFSHGKEGSPHGSKSKIINKICEANNVKFTTIDYKHCNSVNERIALLDTTIKDNSNPLILAGCVFR